MEAEKENRKCKCCNDGGAETVTAFVQHGITDPTGWHQVTVDMCPMCKEEFESGRNPLYKPKPQYYAD